jgi:CRP-like cAMP-binding protein
VREGSYQIVFSAEPEIVPKGTRIYQPGDTATHLYRVISGSVGVGAVAPDGDELMLHRYGAGEVFGELCFCGRAQAHFAIALEPTTIVSAAVDRIVAALRDRPELAMDLIAALSARVAGVYAELRSAAADTLPTRLARTLFELCAAADGDGWCHLPRHYTHEELALLLGVRRESLTRAMIDLRALGLIDYTARSPLRVAPDALRRFVEPDRLIELLPR